MHTATAKQTYRNIVAERLVAIDFEKESTNSLMRASVLLQYGVTSMCSCFLVCTNGPKCGVKFGEWMKTRKLKKKKNLSISGPGHWWPSTPKSHCDRSWGHNLFVSLLWLLFKLRWRSNTECRRNGDQWFGASASNTHTQRIGRESMNYIIYYSLVHAQLVSHIFSSPTFTFCSNTIHMSRFASFISTMAAPI